MIVKYLLIFSTLFSLYACHVSNKQDVEINITDIKNDSINQYHFLEPMYHDSFFPKPLVDEGKGILINLCYKIEQQKPKTNKEFLVLTQEATEAFNQLDAKFMSQGSELETVAREAIAVDMEYIAKVYGFNEDIETLIENMEW